MIRRIQETDIDRAAEIWLDTNIKTHDFISAQYWKSNFDTVKEQFSHSEIYLYEEDGQIQGFAGLYNEYIAGIFVAEEAQSRGIGRLLISYIKEIRSRLSLSVYQKNTRAVKFYEREHFKIQSENIDGDTGEKEYIMVWGGR